jgi:hypothetical protein
MADYLEDAKLLILDYTNRTADEWLPVMEVYQRQLAATLENREGTEGETTRSEGGISRSFETDIMAPFKKPLMKYVKIKAVRF